jgi:hypothetical protein
VNLLGYAYAERLCSLLQCGGMLVRAATQEEGFLKGLQQTLELLRIELSVSMLS